MSGSGSESDCELIIDPELLRKIQEHCRKIEAEEARRRYSAEHFAAVVPGMPPKVRQFFEQHKDPVPPWRLESTETRVERERLTDLGGWAGG